MLLETDNAVARSGATARTFDYDQARRMRETGMGYQAIADELGVNVSSVYYACNPHRNQARLAAKKAARDRRRLRLAGAPVPCTDARWRELQAWIERRHGHAGTYSRSQVSARTVIPRATR